MTKACEFFVTGFVTMFVTKFVTMFVTNPFFDEQDRHNFKPTNLKFQKLPENSIWSLTSPAYQLCATHKHKHKT